MSRDDVYAVCDRCGATIYYGNACVTINRNIEQPNLRPDGEAEITVIESTVLGTFCADCGNSVVYATDPE